MTIDLAAAKAKWASRAHDGDGNPRLCETFIASDGYPSIAVGTEHPLTEDDIDALFARIYTLERLITAYIHSVEDVVSTNSTQVYEALCRAVGLVK